MRPVQSRPDKPMPAPLKLQHPPLYSVILDDFEKLNQQLIEGFLQHGNDPDVKQTHYFHDRYENIYLQEKHIAAIGKIKQAAVQYAAEILQQPTEQLKAGLWFNAMGKGHVTTAHRHDDDDELLSAVYYVQTPENSGELEFTTSHCTTRLKPQAGMMAFFPPDLMHSVGKNLSDELRLSLGINIGPA